MEHLPESLNYIVIALLTVTESATMMFMAGFAAHKGWVEIVPGVLLAAFTGSFLGTQALYYFGRRKGPSFFASRPKWQKAIAPVSDWLQRHQRMAVAFIRFVPGVRVAAHIALGMTDISIAKFTMLNALGAGIWAVVLTVVGYYSGFVLAGLAELLGLLDWHVAVGISAIGLLSWLCVVVYRDIRYQRNEGHKEQAHFS